MKRVIHVFQEEKKQKSEIKLKKKAFSYMQKYTACTF